MLTISSVAVSPWPQSSPAAKAQPVTPVKGSGAVSRTNAGVPSAAEVAGDGASVQAAYAPSALPPVDPTGQVRDVDMFNNAAAPERSGQVGAPAVRPEAAEKGSQAERAQQDDVKAAVEAQARAEATQRFKGELPVEYKTPVQQAMDTQINELLPNMWKASRAAVDVIIGEEARAAAQARIEQGKGLEKSAEAAETYVAVNGGKSVAGQVLNTRV